MPTEISTIDFQVLLKIALNQRIRDNLETSLPEILDLYQRELNCSAVGVYNKNIIKFHTPEINLFVNELESFVDLVSLKSNDDEELYYVKKISKKYFYALKIEKYGWMILIKECEFQDEILIELGKIVRNLGNDICQLEEDKRLKILQHLFDESSDAIQISDEKGWLYYINKEASKRLGIDKADVSKYHVSDFEKIFNDYSEWINHIEESENSGKMLIEGTNISQLNGKEIPFEVTVSLIEIDSKKFVLANSRDISIRKEQESKIKENSEKLKSILQEMTDVLWSVSIPDYKLIFVTPSVETLFEVNPDQWLRGDDCWQSFIHPEDREIINEINLGLEKSGKSTVKHRIKTPSGKIKWVQTKAKYIYDAEYNPIRLDVVVIDKTEQVKTEIALQKELQSQDILIDIATTYINLDSKDLENTIDKSLAKMGLFTGADRAYIFDYDFEKQTTSNTYEWCNDDITAEIKNLQNIPLSYFPNWLHNHQRGEAFYVPDVSKLNEETNKVLKEILEPQGIKSLITIPMIDGDELVGFVGFDSVKNHYNYSDSEQRLLFLFGQMLIKIRNRKKWENQLTIQEEKYRNMIANMNLGLLETDENYRIIYTNQSFLEMSGYSENDLLGKHAAKILLNEEKRKIIFDEHLNRYPDAPDSYEIEIIDKQGNKKYWFISGAANYNDKGQYTGRIGVHLDITKQKELAEELARAKNIAEKAANAKELFLANMSHEIRTPLNIIIGMIRLLSKQNLTKDQQFYVKQSESSANHLLTIINHILDISKIDSGDFELLQHAFSPSAMMHNIHSVMYSQAKEKNLEFQIDVDPNIKTALIGDETRLRQVLINLIGNAIKFTESGRVTSSIELISQTENKQTVKFEVSDTGVGMSNDFSSKMFNKFSQEQDSFNRKFDGTGLGLAISNDLVKLMGGKIDVVSKKNKGSTFSFILDFNIGQVKDLSHLPNIKVSNAFGGLNALLVEDNEMNRFIAVQSLNHLGFNTKQAENGQMAIDILQKEKFDIILMDIQMPIMDGVEATTYIRDVLNIDTPIIALTANAFKHDIDNYLNKGMNDFITKPFDEKIFFQKIQKVINLSSHIENYDLEKTSNKLQIEEQLFNLRTVEIMLQGNIEMISQLVEIFISVTKENIETLNKALHNKDHSSIQKIAHKIKPSIDQFHIESLSVPIRLLEKYDANKMDHQELEKIVNQVTDTLNRVIDELVNQEVLITH